MVWPIAWSALGLNSSYVCTFSSQISIHDRMRSWDCQLWFGFVICVSNPTPPSRTSPHSSIILTLSLIEIWNEASEACTSTIHWSSRRGYERPAAAATCTISTCISTCGTFHLTRLNGDSFVLVAGMRHRKGQGGRGRERRCVEL